jgi:hypothetical protein
MKSAEAPKPLHITPNYIISELSGELHEGKRGRSSRRGPNRTNKTISIRQYIVRAEKLKNYESIQHP